ncbi:MAG: hypothetical protein LBJ12_04785 [Oscillospiraceae bacterium]|jgi:hypothetical protein|nr:hypothetical protein [Oscillospiraceae bacterium]
MGAVQEQMAEMGLVGDKITLRVGLAKRRANKKNLETRGFSQVGTVSNLPISFVY